MRQLNRAVVLSLFTLITACSDDDEDLGSDRDPSTADDGSVRDASTNLDAGGNNIDAAVGDAGAGSDAKVDRSALSNVGTDASLNYADNRYWACRPDQGDKSECRVNLDATEVLKDGGTVVVPHVVAKDPKFDCFYIYPTVATSGGGNMTNFADIRPVLDPLLSQAARFNRMCEVYAPLYRQVSLTTNDAGTPTTQGDGTLGVRDVIASFDEYLSKWNKGRDFVILGHSQGTRMAVELIKARIDQDPAVRARLISAVILGGDPRVPEGQDVGGSFANVPTCTKAGQTGCLVAFDSYTELAKPGTNALFGRRTAAGRVACTEPAALTGNTGNYKGSYFRATTNNPAFASPGFTPANLTTPFFLYRDYFKGECVQNGDFNYLEISVNKSADDQREDPPYRNPRLEAGGWGLHLVDWNLPMEDIMTLVEQQAATKAK